MIMNEDHRIMSDIDANTERAAAAGFGVENDSAANEQQRPAASANAASALPLLVASTATDKEELPAHNDNAPPLNIHHRSRKRKLPSSSRTVGIQAFQHGRNSLRLPASSVSALTGYHPYQNLPQLFFDLLYQSSTGHQLLQLDASLLGLQLCDAQSLERDHMLQLAKRISADTVGLIHTVLSVSEGTTTLNSIEEIHSIQSQIQTQARQTQQQQQKEEDGRLVVLTDGEIASLVEASRGHMARGFGTMQEESALDLYERRVGCSVRERNVAMMTWEFERVDGSDGGVSARPMGRAIRREMMMDVDDAVLVKNVEKGSDEVEVVVIDDNDNTSTTPSANVDTASSSSTSEKNKCFFKIVGAVDGIRDEIYIDPVQSSTSSAIVTNDSSIIKNSSSVDKKSMSVHDLQSNIASNNNNYNTTVNAQEANGDEYNFSDDEDTNNEQWTIRPIIVECKHRLSQAKVPPPLYDQIQTCLYMNMYNVEEADLIQVVKRDKSRLIAANAKAQNDVGEDGKENDQPAKSNFTTLDSKGNSNSKNEHKKNEEESNTEITISRISLHDPIHNHQHHWNETLLPRLASFVDAVYNVREDDGKRYRFLMALAQAQNRQNDDKANVEAWKVLWEELPWLKFCDTSFGRRSWR